MKIADKISLSFLALVMILTAVATSVFYHIMRESYQKSIYDSLIAVCTSRTDHIETYLRMLESSVNQASRSVVLPNLLKTSKDDPAYKKAFEDAAQLLKSKIENDTSVYEYLLLNASGQVLVATDESDIGQDKSGDLIFLGAMQGVHIKDAYFLPEKELSLIAISAPLFESGGKGFLGVLVARLKLDDLNRIVTNRTGLGKTGEIYIINKYGYMITPSRFKQGTFLRQKTDTEAASSSCHALMTHPKGRALSYEGRKALLPSHQMPNVFPNYLGRRVLGAYEYLPRMQWGVLTEIDAKEALAPLAKIRSLFLGMLFVLPFVSWLLGLFIARLIMNSLRLLRQGTKIIGRGNLDYKVGTDAKDEVGELSRAFDAMVVNLKNTTTSVDHLHQEIKERHKAEEKLRESEERFRRLFECSRDAFLTLEPPFWKFATGNQAAVEIFGMKTQEELLSVGLVELSPEKQPDGRASSEKAKEMNGIALRDGSHYFEWTHKRLDGKVFSAMILLNKVEFGGKVNLQATVRDITREKKDEQQLIKDKELLKEKSEELNEALKEAQQAQRILANLLAENIQVQEKLEQSITEVKKNHQMMLQSEKLASIGQLAAGIAHEINNPTGFIGSNLSTLENYVADITRIFRAVESLKVVVEAGDLEKARKIREEITVIENEVDISYVFNDMDNLLRESKEGISRIANIVRDLKTFSHTTEDVFTSVNLCKIIDLSCGI